MSKNENRLPFLISGKKKIAYFSFFYWFVRFNSLKEYLVIRHGGKKFKKLFSCDIITFKEKKLILIWIVFVQKTFRVTNNDIQNFVSFWSKFLQVNTKGGKSVKSKINYIFVNIYEKNSLFKTLLICLAQNSCLVIGNGWNKG